MRRPPGLWILLSAGVLWLCLQDVYGIRATALIFGKSTTTTTTEASGADASANEEELSSTEPSQESTNVTGPTLTGNPQIDYVWDPNLPKELNGYNLSDYPFYERVPDEEIEFKCDGLHDGFYASVPHKCQVYHHCLFGTRFDFLCANYTAFDQKTFICHFVSEVDCQNSKKYWHRNDALYQAATTTTSKPLVIYTTPAADLQPAGSPVAAAPPRRPGGGVRRRPTRRRRPQYDYYDDDYYDDYYVERPRDERRRKRPRPRPRPIYDDEYDDDYEDERFERRGGGRRDRDRDRKRPYERDEERRRKNNDRRKYEYDDEEDDDRRSEEDVKKPRPNNNKRKSNSDETDKRSSDRTYEKRRPYGESNKRKNVDADEETNDRRPGDRGYENRRPATRDEDYDTKPTRKSQRRPFNDYDDEPQADEGRPYDTPKKEERRRGQQTTEASRAIIKPVSGTIYDRPRVAPKIKLPVPKNEADKYAYKPISTQAPPPADDEYYDDYEDEPKPKSSRKPIAAVERPNKSSEPEEPKETRKYAAVSRPRAPTSKKPLEDSYESYERPQRPTTKRPKFGNRDSNTRYTSSIRKRPVVDEYYDEYEEDRSLKDKKGVAKTDAKEKTSTTTSTTTTTSPTTTTTTEKPEQKAEPVVRVVKRPFLPSRGGNPFSARGLQPVGVKATEKPTIHEEDDYDLKAEEPEIQNEKTSNQKLNTKYELKNPQNTPRESPSNNNYQEEDQPVEEKKTVFKPSPVIIKVPVRQKFVSPDDEYPSRTSEYRPTYQTNTGPRTTQKPKVPERNPLDLNEYDVTLNDALNPTLPNLPVRGFPSGFSAANDYTFSAFQRPRYVIDPVISSSNSEYTYQVKPARPTRYEGQQQQQQQQPQQQYSNVNTDFKGQYSTISEQNFRPRQQTQAYYTSY